MIAELKVAVLKTFGTQIVGARRMGINEGRLSYLIQEHDLPTERERKLLVKWLGRDYFAEETKPQSDGRRGPMEILADQRGAVIAGTEPKKD